MAGNSAAVAEMKEAAALMRDSGLTVLSSSGWESRGRSSSVNYWAALAHHTAATSDIDDMLINGRPDLDGPLCNWALHKNGDWVLIASGRANHAGEGTLPSSESYGIEATGPQNYPNAYGPAAFPDNYDSYEVGVACLIAVMGGDVGDVFGHKETATPPGRKIDPYFDMGGFRRGVDTAEGGDDLTGEEHDWLEKVYKGMIVPGTAKPYDSYVKIFDRVKQTNTALAATGTTGPEQTVEYLYGRVRAIEQAVAALCEAAGIPFTPYTQASAASSE